jgi:hypothetical protein
MKEFLKSRVDIRALAFPCIVLGLLWWRSIYLSARFGKADGIGLFWAGILFFGPFVGLIFSTIISSLFLSGCYKHKLWAIAGIIGGISPAVGWLLLWLIY